MKCQAKGNNHFPYLLVTVPLMQTPTLFTAFSVRNQLLAQPHCPPGSQHLLYGAVAQPYREGRGFIQGTSPRSAELCTCPCLISWDFMLDLCSTHSRSIALNGGPTLKCIGCNPWFGVIHKLEEYILQLLLQVTDKNTKQERSQKSLLRNSKEIWLQTST